MNSTCICTPSSHLNWNNLVQNHRGNIPVLGMQTPSPTGGTHECLLLKSSAWGLFIICTGGKICINVVELAQYDDDWHRNRTHQRGMRDFWEASLCFGKYWCFSSGRNKFELCDRRGNRCAHLSVSSVHTGCRDLSVPVHNCLLLLHSKTTAWWVWDPIYQPWKQRQWQCQRFPQMTTNIFICMLPTDANTSCRFK